MKLYKQLKTENNCKLMLIKSFCCIICSANTVAVCFIFSVPQSLSESAEFQTMSVVSCTNNGIPPSWTGVVKLLCYAAVTTNKVDCEGTKFANDSGV